MGLLVDGNWHTDWYDTKSSNGEFIRQDSQFRRWVGSEGLPAGPLGQGSTIISGNPFGARLQNAEGDFISESPEQLVLDHTGWEIPINHLLYWIKGIPAPFGQPTITYNQHGTVDTMEQDGWALKYDRYGVALNQTLPQRIKISKNGLKVTLVIKQWLPLTSEESDGETP